MTLQVTSTWATLINAAPYREHEHHMTLSSAPTGSLLHHPPVPLAKGRAYARWVLHILYQAAQTEGFWRNRRPKFLPASWYCSLICRLRAKLHLRMSMQTKRCCPKVLIDRRTLDIIRRLMMISTLDGATVECDLLCHHTALFVKPAGLNAHGLPVGHLGHGTHGGHRSSQVGRTRVIQYV